MSDLVNQAYEEAHRDYERRKAEIISKLKTIQSYLTEESISKTPTQWLQQTIDFINEKEY